jgi:hypothetical protein
MAKNKETSTRGAGKFIAGTRNALVNDIQNVHELFNQHFPTEVPDIDFYRKHGKFTDDAWKRHFPRFEDFVAEAGVTPAAASVCWHLNQALKLLQQDFSGEEVREIEAAFNRVYSVLPPDEESQRAYEAA